MVKTLEKSRLAKAVAVAVLGAGSLVGMSTASASDMGNTPWERITNDSNPGNVEGGSGSEITLRVPAGDTEIAISGYVKADFIYDSDADVGDSFAASAIPTGDVDGDPHFRAHARQSRFVVKSTSELSSGDTLLTHIEGDFFSSIGNQAFSNSDALRLRHAYFSVGGWTIGQFWTNFMDFVAYPSTVDFFGPVGKSFLRQPQIRYTFPNGLSFSIENPETLGGGPGANGSNLGESFGNEGRDVAPDITAKWSGGPGGPGGTYELSAVVRSLGVRGESALDEIDDSVGGFGVNLAGAWDFDVGVLSASTTFGSGLGRYVLEGFGNGVFITEEGELEPVEAASLVVSYMHRWTDTSSSLVSLGAFQNDDDFAANGIDSAQSLHVNYQWKVDKISYGAEVIFGNFEDTAGETGTNTRLQFAARVDL